MNIRVEEYLRADGSNPFRRWREALDPIAEAKVIIAVSRLGAGNMSRVKWFDGIGECVIDWGPGYRIYLAWFEREVIMLYGGGTKRRQSADIDRAKALHEECKARRRMRKA